MVRPYAYSLKRAGAVAALGCLIITGIAATDSPRASNDPSVLITVNRTNKGDRLSSAAALAPRLKELPAAGKLSAPPNGPPLGCDPLFSPIADPAKARLYYRRCAA